MMCRLLRKRRIIRWDDEKLMITLFKSILNYEGTSLHSEVLLPWLKENQFEIANWLTRFKLFDNSAKIDVEDLWELYALSRINDVLLLNFQSQPNPNLKISHIEYLDFFNQLGFTTIEEMDFHPFYHEIVGVTPIGIKPHIESSKWSGLMLGNMLFSRAGVCISSNNQYIEKNISENSTLYWAYTRSSRSCYDLSHGWGSNSQWRTKFRRDYKSEHGLLYNVDATEDITYANLEAEENQLTREDFIELIRHRCMVKCSQDSSDLFPFNFKFTENFSRPLTNHPNIFTRLRNKWLIK